jgi:hypothetical protein
MPVALLLGVISQLMPITQLDQQPSKFRDHTHIVSVKNQLQSFQKESIKDRSDKSSKKTEQCAHTS